MKTTIKAGTKSVFTQVMEQQENRGEALDKVAGKVIGTFVEAIRGTQTTYTSELVVLPMDGPVTGTFQCVIS